MKDNDRERVIPIWFYFLTIIFSILSFQGVRVMSGHPTLLKSHAMDVYFSLAVGCALSIAIVGMQEWHYRRWRQWKVVGQFIKPHEAEKMRKYIGDHFHPKYFDYHWYYDPADQSISLLANPPTAERIRETISAMMVGMRQH